MKEKITNVLNKIKENKRIILKTTISVLVVFIFAFSFYNLNNPTYFNKLLASIGDTPANDAFEDKDFYSCVVESYNNQTGESRAYTDKLEDDELNKITSLKCDGRNIESSKGIEKLTKLTYLDLSRNYDIKNINLSGNTNLINLLLENTDLINLDLSKNVSLTELKLRHTSLTNLDLSNNIALTSLSLTEDKLKNIDLSNNTALTSLYIEEEITSLDLTNNTALTNLYINGELSNINLNNNINLLSLSMRSTNVRELDLSKNTSLTKITLEENDFLQGVSLNNNINLESLYITYNSKFSFVDLSNNKKLSELHINDNNLDSLNISNNLNLTSVSAHNNNISEFIGNYNITFLSLSYNNLTDLNLSKMNKLESIDVSDNYLTNLNLDNKQRLISVNAGNNNLVSVSLNNTYNLNTLYLNNNLLENINLTGNTNLNTLFLNNNNLSNLDLSNNINIGNLSIDGNENLYPHIPIMKVGDTYEISDNLILPSDFNIEYSVSDDSIISLSNNVIEALKDGTASLYTRFGSVTLERKILVGNVKIYVNDYDEERYLINEKEKYIYLKDGARSSSSLENLRYDIKTNFGEIQVDEENNLLRVVSSNDILLEYKLVYLNNPLRSENSNYYVYSTQVSKSDILDINAINCDYDTKDDKLYITYDGKIIDTKSIIYVFIPDSYRMFDDILLTTTDDFENFNTDIINNITSKNQIKKDKINVLNAKMNLYIDDDVEEGKEQDTYFEIKDSNDELIIEMYYARIISNNYNLSKDYIYLGNKNFDNDIVFRNYGDGIISTDELIELNVFDIDDDHIEFWYVDEVRINNRYEMVKMNLVCNWDFIKVTSDKYDMNNDVIKLKDDEVLDLNSIKVTNATLKLEDSKLLIMYDDEIVKEFKVEGGKKETVTTKPNAENNTPKKNTTTKKSRNTISKTLKNTKKASISSTSKVVATKKTTTKVVNSTNKVTDNKVNKNVIYQDNILLTLSLCLMTSLVICLAVMYKKRRNN